MNEEDPLEEILCTIVSFTDDSRTSLETLHDQLTRQLVMMQDISKEFHAAKAAGQSPKSPLLELIGQAVPMLRCLTASHILANEAEVQRSVCGIADEHFIDAARDLLLNSIESQVQLAPKSYASVCHFFSESCIATGRAREAISPLKAAASALSPQLGCMTAVDCDLLECCIYGKFYNIGARWLDSRPVYEVDPKRTALAPQHFLKYFYFGGAIYIGQKRWKDALDFLQMVYSAPAQQISSLAVEARKKAILVGLILKNAAPQCPPYTSVAVTRGLAGLLNIYIEIEKAFGSDDHQQLKTCVNSSERILIKDGNLGLANQVVATHKRMKLLKLTHAYLTLSLEDIAKKLSVSNIELAEEQLLNMVSKGSIHIKIEQFPKEKSIVHFMDDDSSDMDTSSMYMQSFKNEIEETMKLAKRMKDVNNALALDDSRLGKSSDRSKGIVPPCSWDRDVDSTVDIASSILRQH